MEPTPDPNLASPLVEKTFPPEPEPPQPPDTKPPGIEPPRRRLKPVLIGIVALAGLFGMLGGTFWYGYARGQAAQAKAGAGAQTIAPLQVPKGATIIEQCSKGRGAQYVLPANIPHGPVFNVYHGKVIGIEYMISPTDLASDMTFFNLPTYGQKFDHLDIGLLSHGHTGFPDTHYHVDLYTVSRAASEAITCK